MSQQRPSITLIVVGENKRIARRFYDVVIKGIPAHYHTKDLNCYSMDAVRPEGVEIFFKATQGLLTTGAPATSLLFIVPLSSNGELSTCGQQWVKAFPWCHIYHWTTPGSNATQPNAMGVVNYCILSDVHAVSKLWQPLLERAATYTLHTDTYGLMYLIT
jgi:hypothetical protein